MSPLELTLPRARGLQLVWKLGWLPGLLLLLLAVVLLALTQGKYPITLGQIGSLLAYRLGLSELPQLDRKRR